MALNIPIFEAKHNLRLRQRSNNSL